MNEEYKKSGYSCLQWGLIIVFGLILFVILAANIVVRIVINKQIHARFANDPQGYERYMSSFEEPVRVPDEWFEPMTVSEETQKKIDAFKQFFNNYDVANLSKALDRPFQKRRDWFTPDELESLRQEIEAEAEAGKIARDTIDAPDYDLGLFSLPIGAVQNPQSFVNMQLIADNMMFVAMLNAHDGKWPEAFDNALAASRMAKRRPCNTLIMHLIGIAIQSKAQRGIARLARQCPDAPLLRDVRLKMQQLEPYVLPHALDWALEAETIAMLKLFQQAGFAADLTPGKPLFYYTQQSTRAMEWTMQQTGSSQMQVRRSWANLGRYIGLGGPIDRLMFVWSEPNLENARIREKTAIAEFNVISTYLAARIAELENGTPAESPELLEKDYLGMIPEDPFMGQSLLWDGTQKAFYSVGPDKSDDGNRVRYNPSNGTVSSGDIFPIGEI